MSSVTQFGTRAAVRLWLTVLVVDVWWWASQRVDVFGVVSLRDALAVIGDEWLVDRFASDLLPSILLVVQALAASIVAGIAIGVVLGSVPALDRATRPLLNFVRTLPKVLLISPALVLLGIGDTLTLTILITGAIWPILLSTVDGIRAIPPILHDLRATYRLRRRDWLLRVALPSASPQIMAGVRTSVSLSVILLVVAQAVGATSGLGFRLRQANEQFQFDELWAAMILFGLLGYGFNLLFMAAERRVLAWDHLRKKGMHDA